MSFFYYNIPRLSTVIFCPDYPKTLLEENEPVYFKDNLIKFPFTQIPFLQEISNINIKFLYNMNMVRVIPYGKEYDTFYYRVVKGYIYEKQNNQIIFTKHGNRLEDIYAFNNTGLLEKGMPIVRKRIRYRLYRHNVYVKPDLESKIKFRMEIMKNPFHIVDIQKILIDYIGINKFAKVPRHQKVILSDEDMGKVPRR